MSLFTEYEFSKCVGRYKGDRHVIKFNCRDQFLVMSFAQFTDRSGLRDIETTLDLCSQDLYRSGLKVMPKSTLAEANEKRDWRIYQDFGYKGTIRSVPYRKVSIIDPSYRSHNPILLNVSSDISVYLTNLSFFVKITISFIPCILWH